MAKHHEAGRSDGAKRSIAGKAMVSERLIKRGAGKELATTVRGTQVEAVIAAAQRSGLLEEKSGRIGGRVSPALVEQAKARTGIKADTDLIEFALANIALDDTFAETFKAIRGTVDPDLKLGF